MRVFKTKVFTRFCRKAGLDDGQLLKAVDELASGLVDAELGGEVFKQRIARKGQGKSGGFRTILFFRSDHRTIFVFGFAKNDQTNIESVQLEEFKELAGSALGLAEDAVDQLVVQGTWLEIARGKG